MEAAFVWDEGRVAALTKMIAENYPARVIAERLGTSRNAVLGKTHRMGISAPIKPKSSNVSKPRKPRAKREQKQPRVFREVVRIVSANISGGLRLIRTVEAEQYKLRCVEIVPRNVSLIDLEPGDCRYPYGDETVTFCGHPKQADSSYCTPHHFLCCEKPRVPVYRFVGRAA
jgi:GcrA cell cycle regulator